ncbi:MAG: hypothetical protein HYY23_09005 [Verrucomicrobia bacterium]|nr:hypothetical protein [Verrucomicrobiota bacterium]
MLTKTAAAESLAIYRNSANKIWIEANSPLEIGYRLQASVDFQSWTDINDQASGPLSYRIDQPHDTNSFFRLRTWSTKDAPLKLVLLGDSTVADYALSGQSAGWGQGIYGYLKPNVRVINLAIAFQSTKSFLASIQKDYLERIKPEFVLISFGRVDALVMWDASYYTSMVEYEANLKAIIRMVREFGGTPILVTPTGPREFDAAGKIVPLLEDRSQVVRDVAADSQAYLIDLHELSKNLFNELGPNGSAYISTWDNVHFTLKGADVIAGLAVNAFPGILRAQVK